MDRPSNPTLIRAYRIVALITLALVLVQAALAGRGVYIDSDWFDVHEVVANVISVVAIVQVLLVFRAGFTSMLHLPRWTSLLVVLIVAQTGLGYVGRDEPDAAAIHIPMGVLIFGLAMLVTVLAFFDSAGNDE